jgi:uncharacterized protein YlbG (UPF0298 family)
MARARNIKPAFFNNDLLAEIDPIGRLLFIGMWTIADYKGDIEWREKKIKAQVLPYDNCDVKNIAINLDKLGFIRFYSDSDTTYINITNFSKHQNPHKNEREKGSEIPAYTELMRQAVDLKGLTINPDKSRLNQDEDGTNPADSLILIPDPCSLDPDSLILKPQSNLPAIAEEYFFKLPTNKTDVFYLVTIEEIHNYKSTYQAVDIEQQYREILSWLNTNQKNRKTIVGMPKFINAWLSKAQNKAPRVNTSSAIGKTQEIFNQLSEINYDRR